MHPLTAALPVALAQLLRDVPLSAGKVEFAWNAAVGPALQRVSSVRLENRVLIVDVSGRQWAREISRSANMILPRLQRLLGEEAIVRLEVRERL
jgi:hypothetical protein